MRLLSVAGVVAVVLVACTSFTEDAGGPPSGALDAGPTGDASGSPEASAVDGAPPGCAALFCASFDGDPFDGEWSGYQRGPQQQVEIDLLPTEEAPRSPGRALRLKLPAAGSLYQDNYVTKRLPVAKGAHSLTYGFAVRVTTANTLQGQTRIGAMTWTAEGKLADPLWLRFVLRRDELTIRIENVSAVAETTTRRLVVGRWYVMSATITFNSMHNATIEVFADGVSYDQSSFDPLALPGDGVELRLGADYAEQDWRPTVVDFDDVTFDVR